MKTNPHQNLYQYCAEEKQRAMELWQTSEDQKIKYNAQQAINAWDELAGQLHKHKAVTKKRFEKTKGTALWIVGLMTNSQYKKQTKTKIEQLNL